ncbi:uncharacterized protein LOC108738623 isoform X2 [Agrilus planipennis]|uniref:Uncharacterized protein LOC108738623 isoform X2 n=1 Tax=Agrilus planipennis TaxID=224129 RepID=A0A7F5RM89_AGRPL|nr:uncharacterized protein LOC108738623 isoform X2 [Agrilus planipennis]
MSTLPGLASKGEKGKSKYQSLDINNLWKAHTGEPLETQHQKNTLPRKHGMQSLGKVPTARRPPANLPSLKSEHTGSDAAVSLVPSGGTGWGKQEGSPSSTTSQTTSVTNSTVSSSSNSSSNSLPVSNQTVGPSPVVPSLPISKQSTPAATPVTNDKSWSAVMSGNDILQPPPYHSPQFQHEFPSLSAGDGAPTRPGTDMQYGPGPSLRPQNEGSWIQGGARPQPPSDLHSRNSNSAPPGASPQPSGPAGPPQVPLPQQYRGVIPPFMCRGNFASNGHGLPTFPNPPAGAPKWSTGGPNRGVIENRSQAPQRPDEDEVVSRPIIKEEDLTRMDDLARDVGWASYDDIDYNQKLAFSDDESSPKEDGRENGKTDQNSDDRRPRGGAKIIRHINEEEEVWKQRRMQQTEKVALAVERAKQRKEEEEKRFLEQKQAAAKKLQMLEEKMSKNKRERELEDTQGTISPLAVPSQPIMPVPIPVPEWEKEKENQTNTSSNNSSGSNVQKASAQQQQQKDVSSASEFHKLAQIEGRSFVRKDSQSVEREPPRDTREIRDQMGPNFSKQFQSNLPPRFKKQQQLRNIASSPQLQNNNSNNLQTTNYNSDTSSSYSSWQSTQQYKNSSSVHASRQDSEELEEHHYKDNHRNDESCLPSYSNFNSYYDSDTAKSGGKYSEDDNKRDKGREESSIAWEKEKESLEKEKLPKRSSNQDIFEELQMHHVTSDEWRDKYEKEDRYGEKYERPQRPDSRDSRASRDSRHSRESNRDFDYHTSSSSWADSPFDPTFDKKRKENVYTREERSRVVPGPITKERVEAEDYKNDKGLTQLKRGMIIEKPIEKEKTPEKIVKEEEKESKDWATDSGKQNDTKTEEKTITGKDSGNEKDRHEINTDSDNSKPQKVNSDKDKEDGKSHGSSNRRRQDPRGWSTGGPYVYRNTWKRNDSRRGGASGAGSRFGGMKKSSALSKGPSDWLHTESDASADEISSESIRDEKRSPKMSRKISSKDEKNKENRFERSDKDSNKRDNYTPRGEPSRHGRGSSQFRSSGGRGGISRRIDGYGPPPSKSPFSHLDEKETNKKSDNISESEDNKMQNSAGVIGSNRNKDSFKSKSEDKLEGNKSRGSSNSRRNKGRKPKEGSEENCETSDNSEENSKDKSKHLSKTLSARTSSQRRNNSGRPDYRVRPDGSRQPSIKDEKTKSQDDQTGGDQKDEKDTDGFQEVKSKKNLQRPKSGDEKIPSKLGSKLGDDRKDKTLKKPGPALPSSQQQSQFPLAQQVANIPSLMDTPVNPPQPMLAQLNKDKFERNRQNKLPPRFVRQRLQKVQINHHQPPQQQQQQSGIICDDINKVSHNLNMLDAGGALSSAWNKLRVESDGLECTKNPEQSQQQQQSPSQSMDKVVQNNHLGEKPVLDGATPPVNTIIFENTNFKSAPGARRNEKPCKLEESVVIDNSAVMSTFNKPIRDLLNNKGDKQQQQPQQQQVDATTIQMQLAFTKEDTADMKLDFFESELTHLTEDNKNSKNLGGLSRSIHTITSVNNTISTADALNFKIASVKKVWESMPTVMEHNVVVAQDDPNTAASAGFSTSFGADTGALDGSTAFVNKTAEGEDGHERYNASPNQTVTNNTTTNVKPTQQIAGSASQTIHTTGAHQPHSGVVGSGIVGHPLSPPPMQSVIGTGVGLGQPPQQYTSNQHLGYQPSVGGTNQYGMSAIPSPPTVLFNSTQQLQAAAAQSGLYGTFQIDQSQVLGSQGRSQFSQYPNPYGLGQTASSPYSAQSMYLQGAQPHPPPAAQPPPPPDLYTNINSYRLSATGPFAQNQQLNNPTTVLISSTSNSLMSATVKPSTQQISAIGTKAGGAGQAYQQTSQQGQQLYMAYDPTMQAASYLPSTGVIQRGPNGPLQNNVVTALQPSASSFYTGSTGGQTAGYFQQPASSALQSGPLQQHQAAGYGIQGNIFGNPNQSHTSAGLQNFGSHFLSSPMQLAAAAALNAQQYRSQNLPNTTPYIKSMTGQHVGDQGTRQLKSPASQQDVLSSVFNSGPQIPSPKSKQNPKQPVPQSSPTAQHKYNLYQSVNTQQIAQMQRYPTPIQRPMNFQSSMGSVQPTSNGPTNNNPKHKSSNQNQKMRHYYGSQGSNLGNAQHDKMDEKLTEAATNNSATSNSSTMVNKSPTINAGGGGGVAVVGDATKDQTVVVGATKNEETVNTVVKE